eukprot:XP_025006052.1 uncharacterized protein LOC112532368 isoform X3 [Gallus gallus]
MPPTLVATFHRYEDQQRKPLFFELILTLQNYEQHLPPTHVSISAISELANRLGEVQEQVSLLINRDEPIIVSETFDEDQDKQRGLMKELIKLMKIQLIKEDGSPSSPVSSKFSAIEGKRFPARVRNNNKTASHVALWRYLRDHGEDMRKWHDQDTPVLRALVRELQNRPTTSVVPPVTTGGSCHIVGKYRRWKAAVWSPMRQVAEATEGKGESSQFAERRTTYPRGPHGQRRKIHHGRYVIWLHAVFFTFACYRERSGCAFQAVRLHQLPTPL